MSTKSVLSRPTRAAEYLREWTEKDASKLSRRQSAKKLAELIALADQDFGQCRDDADRQAILFVLTGAVQAFNARSGNQSEAVKGLHSAIANRSHGLRGPNLLDRSSPAIKRRSVEEDFHRALVLVALEKWPRQKRKILLNAHRLYGWHPKDMRKFKDNFTQAQTHPCQVGNNNYDGVKHFITELRARYNDGDMDVFQDLLK